MADITAQQRFWNWFIRHESELFDFNPADEIERERIFDLLVTELQKVDPRLTFEFGANEKSREFVVSAAGIKGAFPAVLELTKAAPSLPRWRVIAFQPRREVSVIEFRGKRIDPNDVQFTLLENGVTAGLLLFLPDFRDGDRDRMQIGYLLLDEALGEYDVETNLGLIKMLPRDAKTDGQRYPLADLPRLFDQLVLRLQGLSEKPS